MTPTRFSLLALLGAACNASPTAPTAQPAPMPPAVEPKVVAKSRPGIHELRDEGRLQLGLTSAKGGLSAADRAAAELMGGKQSAQVIEAGQSLFALVQSSCVDSCASEISLSCTIEGQGTELHVHTLLRYELPATKDEACPDICHRELTTCETPKLEAGSYTVKFAGGSLEQKVPGALNVSVLEGN